MEVPCLTDGLTGGLALNCRDREIFDYPDRHQKVMVENHTWFFDTRGTKEVRKEEDMLFLDYPRKNGTFTRVFDLRLIETPKIESDLGSYIQYAIYDKKHDFFTFSRINTLPSLYLNLKVQLFAAVLGNKVLDK